MPGAMGGPHGQGRGQDRSSSTTKPVESLANGLATEETWPKARRPPYATHTRCPTRTPALFPWPRQGRPTRCWRRRRPGENPIKPARPDAAPCRPLWVLAALSNRRAQLTTTIATSILFELGRGGFLP